jgi:hypothetical protein
MTIIQPTPSPSPGTEITLTAGAKATARSGYARSCLFGFTADHWAIGGNGAHIIRIGVTICLRYLTMAKTYFLA